MAQHIAPSLGEQATRDVAEACAVVRAHAYGFYPALVMARYYENAYVPIAGTDGCGIISIGPGFHGETPETRAAVLCHEALHNLCGHRLERLMVTMPNIGRLQVALDMSINPVLARIPVFQRTIVEHGVTPDKYGMRDGLSAARYYELLTRRDEQDRRTEPQEGGQGDATQDAPQACPEPRRDADGDGPDEQGDSQDASGGTPDTDSAAQDTNGGAKGELKKERQDPEPGNIFGEVSQKSEMSAEDAEAGSRLVRKAVEKAVAKASEGGGSSVDAYEPLTQLLKSLGTIPSVDWTAELMHYMAAKCNTGCDWRRPHKRSVMNGIYMPREQSDTLAEAVIIVDTSGSVWADVVHRLLREAAHIVRMFDFETVWVLMVDDCVRAAHENPPCPETLTLEGGCGTCLVDALAWIGNNAPNTEVAIYLTDGDLCDPYAGKWRPNWTGDLIAVVYPAVNSSDYRNACLASRVRHWKCRPYVIQVTDPGGAR